MANGSTDIAAVQQVMADLNSTALAVEQLIEQTNSNLEVVSNKVENMANIVTTKVVVAEGFSFDRQNVIKIHDTGEGYGPRLSYISGTVGFETVDLIVFKSDLEPLNALLPRIAALEGPDKSAEPPFAGLVDINDPALEAFKKSILDAVAQRIVGDDRFLPPADIPKMAVPDRTGLFIQMANGWIELTGTAAIPKGDSGIDLGTMPDKFPFPNEDGGFPVACREVGVHTRFGSVEISSASRTIKFNPGGTVNEVTLSGVRFKARWSA